MIKAIFSAAIYWPLIFFLRLVFIFSGLFVVWMALPFRYTDESGTRDHAWDGWRLVRLPWWAWPWDNLRDGARGDTAGRYWLRDAPKWLTGRNWKMWWWLAIRNPANNFSRFTRGLGCNVAEATVYLLAGQQYVADDPGSEGWQFVMADGPIFNYWGFYYVSRWQVFGKSLVIRLGHKIEPRHNTADWRDDPDKAWKGVTFRIGLKIL